MLEELVMQGRRMGSEEVAWLRGWIEELLESACVHPCQEAGEGRLTGGREGNVRAGADSNGPALILGQAPHQLGQILLPAGSVAQHRQQNEGCQSLGRVGLRTRAVVGQVVEVLGQGSGFGLLVAGAGTGFLFHGGQSRFQVLGLKASSRIPDKIPREESLGFVVGDVEVSAVAPVTVGQAQHLPPLGCVDGALELFRVDEGLNDKDGMDVAGLLVGAETLQGEAKDS